ncbi:MAG: hypothetical protein QGH83_15625, partial [Candidatus Pacebacteria bacterium]|nr:hypothetical protein [Candidatus Paceibacterota bacterium]
VDTTGITFSILENSSYSNKTSIPYIVLHDLNEDGGIVTLSTTSDANTSITNDEGTDVKYFTDFSKYFMTRSRANGELVSIDENSAPYTTPTAVEPMFPANTINGETYTGDATDPTANTDVRHDFFLTPNTTAVGYAGANNDIAENKYVGNTYITLAFSNVTGSFTSGETITDFDKNEATVKTSSNTTTVYIETSDNKGTFTVGEILSDATTSATIESTQTVSNAEVAITLTGSTFSNANLELGFSTANVITLDTDSVSRTDSLVSVIANNHGIAPGEYIVFKGADDAHSEFNDTFIVEDITQNTFTFSTSNSVSVTPTGDFSVTKNVVRGQTSGATVAIQTRSVNASASVTFQSSDLSVGFPIGNTITNQSSTATGIIDNRTSDGAWYQTKTNEVKTFYIDTANDTGSWDYDATNNSQGMETSANTGEFWLKYNEMVKINQLVASSGSGGTFVAPKVVLDIAIATSSDSSGGYDSTIDTKVPGIYLAYPLKTYEDQVHDGITTLEAYNNFANIIVAPEGLEINFDWKPLANSSGVAINTTHITSIGEPGSGLSAYAPEECTVLDKGEFNAHLGAYENSQTSTNVLLKSANPDNRSSGIINDAGTSYDNILTNPMFPALSGKHKNWEDGENDLVGEQPGVLNANDIFAGGYTEVQTGATGGQYRYTIQNDLKWVYATNPKTTPLDAATSSGQGNRDYNVFGTSNWSALYDGYTHASGFGALINSIEDEDATAHTAEDTI